MIDITLRFSTIAEVAAAITQLNGAQQAAVTSVVDTTPKATTGKPKAEKPAAAAASAEPVQSPAQQPAADAKASEAAEPAKPKAVDYPTLQKQVFALAALVQKKGVDTAEWVLSIAKKHGGDNFKALKPETYAAALVDVTDQIAKLEALEEAVA